MRYRRWLLLLEMVLLFVLPPLLILTQILPPWFIIPGLWILTFYAIGILRLANVPLFENSSWGNRKMLGRFATISIIGFTLLFLINFTYLFELIDKNVWAWLAVMIFYPLFSALPQEILYRRFFFFRYRYVVDHRWLFWASALLFAYAHLPYANEIALFGSFVGGMFFTQSYLATRSVKAAWLEHSLYGMVIFTSGLGHYFYHGNIG